MTGFLRTFSGNLLLVFILLLAAVLRLWDLTSIPFSHDEFSALFRLRYDSLSDLIRDGVMTDAHPALVQVFLYAWTALFGRVEWVVKIPFLLMGIASVGLIYQLGKHWYNATAGALSASVFCFLQSAVLHSQAARPYSSGLFLVLGCMLAWEYYRLHGKRIYLAVMAVAMWLAALNHYFSLLEVTLFGLYAYFITPANLRRNYSIAVAGAIIAFLPHIPVTLAQLGLGGIGEVLSPPDSAFLKNYLIQVLHHSWIVAIPILLLAAFAWISPAILSVQQRKNVILALFLFAAPIIIGAFYSVFRAPVLMERSLFFSLPFLFFFLFGSIRELPSGWRSAISVALCLLGTYSLVSERKHYHLIYRSGFDGVLRLAWEAHNRGAEVWVSGFKPYLNYSAAKTGLDSTFYHHLTASCDHRCFEKTIASTADGQVGIGRTQQLFVPDPTWDAAILQHFPALVSQHNFLNADFRLFTRQEPAASSPGIYRERMPHGNHLQADASRLKGTVFGFTRNEEFGIGYEVPFSEEHFPHPNREIAFVARLSSSHSLAGTELVLAISDKDSIVFYRSDTAPEDSLVTLRVGFRLCDFSGEPESCTIKGYLWNRTKLDFNVLDFEFLILPGNPVQYGVTEPIYEE